MCRHKWILKKLRATDRERPPLFFLLLRAVQLGVHISEMELLTIGTLLDMYSEMQNDEVPEAYNRIPTQHDFNMF